MVEEYRLDFTKFSEEKLLYLVNKYVKLGLIEKDYMTGVSTYYLKIDDELKIFDKFRKEIKIVELMEKV